MDDVGHVGLAELDYYAGFFRTDRNLPRGLSIATERHTSPLRRAQGVALDELYAVEATFGLGFINGGLDAAEGLAFSFARSRAYEDDVLPRVERMKPR
jgi:hypothetical protein